MSIRSKIVSHGMEPFVDDTYEISKAKISTHWEKLWNSVTDDEKWRLCIAQYYVCRRHKNLSDPDK